MSQFNNLHSERILKQRVQNHEFDFMEGAWEDMEQMLDKNPAPGPASDNSPMTNFVSFSSLIKLVIPAVILFSIFGWITIQQTDNSPQEIEEVQPSIEKTPEQEFVPVDNMPIAAVPIDNNHKDTENIQRTSEYNYNSYQKHNDMDHRIKGKQNAYNSKAVIYANSASFSSPTFTTEQKTQVPTIESIQKNQFATSVPSSLGQTMTIQPLDLVSSVDFNQHTSIAEFTQTDTSIYYTGNLKLNSLNFKPKRMNWGLAIGASIGSIDWSKFKFSAAPQAGIFVSYQFNDKYALQAELLVKNKANYNLNNSITETKNTLGGLQTITDNYSIKSLWFVELPLMIKKKLNTKNLDLLLGLRPSYIAHQTGNWSEKQEGLDNKEQQGELPSKVRDGIVAFDVGFLLGLEYQLTRKLSLNIRYTQGFTDITDNAWFVENDLHLNSDFQLAMQYQF